MTTTTRIARAHHDLNDVTEIRISGWTGRIAIVPRDDSDWVTVEAPERHDGEFWTFTRQQDGVVTCFTSLLGSPSLLGPVSTTMTVRLPADVANSIGVRLHPGHYPDTLATTHQGRAIDARNNIPAGEQ